MALAGGKEGAISWVEGSGEGGEGEVGGVGGEDELGTDVRLFLLFVPQVISAISGKP
jgi:hypothetical protein